MKLTNKLYFDYNATSPLADSVKQFLVEGDVDFLNPSSLHHHGRYSRKIINQTILFLKDFFGLKNFLPIFHSGATEGLNSAMFSFLKQFPEGRVIVFHSDHPAVVKSAIDERFILFDVNADGTFPEEKVRSYLQKNSGPVLLNYLWAHNETGQIWPLSVAEKLKDDFAGLKVSVDAVQTVGKIEDYKKLSPLLDCYTFSGHKFGSLKGIGWTLVHPDCWWSSLFYGGGQQQGLRPGTENTLGVYSIELALKDLEKKVIFSEARSRQKEYALSLSQVLGERGALFHQQFNNVASNNVSFFYYPKKADVVANFFDLHQVSVSVGSACSSGALKPSPTLLSMGKGELASHFVRVTLPPFCGKDDQNRWDNLLEIAKKLPF